MHTVLKETMLRSLTKYANCPVNYHNLYTTPRSIAIIPNVLHQKRMLIRFYAADGRKTVQNNMQENINPNLIKQTPPEFRKAETDIDNVKSSQGSSGNSDQDSKKKKLVFFLSPIVAAALIYQLMTLKSKQNEDEVISEIKKQKKKRKDWIVQKHPPTSDDIPTQVPYLLIGGGTASFAAFRAIKSNDPTAQVLVISNEPYYPYMRPPLSKEMFYDQDRESVRNLKFKQWNGKERSLFYEHEDFYADINTLMSAKNGGIAVARGWAVSKVDPQHHKVYLEDGTEISYRKCLIATGAKPKNLPLFEKASEKIKEKVMLYRNIYDFEELEDIMREGAKSLVIVGGGFLGSELACALARRGKSQGLAVHQIFREEGNMGHVLPEYLSKWTTAKVKNEGVHIISKAEVSKVELTKDSRLLLSLNNGQQLEADHVVVAVGVEPNTELAETSALEVDKAIGGFVANSELEARTNLYVAGDCASFYDEKLGRRRIEHHDNAVVSGRLAGENMTGAAKTYTHQSMLWSDLGPDVGYEAIGIVKSSLPTFAVYAKPAQQNSTKDNQEPTENSDSSVEDYVKGVIFYLKDNVIVGIVLWNIFNRIAIARQVLKEGKTFEDLNEVAKLFDIHSDL